jgi:Putative addiction module component
MHSSVVEREALLLPAQERAALVSRLLLSLEETTEPEFERVWGAVSAHRAAQADLGIVQVISGAEVALQARALLR